MANGQILRMESRRNVCRGNRNNVCLTASTSPSDPETLSQHALLLACPPSECVHTADASSDSVSPPTRCHDNLAEAFVAVARSVPTGVALASEEGVWSYGSLLESARAVRNRLFEDGSFAPGDRVLLLLPNGPEYIAGFFGTLMAGGVAVPVPPDAESQRLQHILQTCEIRQVLTTEGVLRRRKGLSFGQVTQLAQQSESAAGADSSSLAGGNALAAIFFTSGSTGEPKGVMLSHSNLLSNARSICEYLGISADDRALGLLPFYHAFGNSVLQTHLLSGATLILAGSLTFPETIFEALREFRVTSLSGVPEMCRVLLARTSLGTVELPALRYVAVAGGRLDPDQALVLASRIAPAQLVIMYGQTEATARLSYLPPDLLESRYGSIGRGIPGVELQVVDDSGRGIEPDGTGEIRAHGPNIMLGYWQDPEGTAAVLRDGWLYTGDLATVDADGFIYPQGRRSGLVKIGGYRLHPREIEEFIRHQADLADAVAVSYEDPELGTRLALFVQIEDPDAAMTATELRRLCATHLPRYKVPEHVEVLRQFPLNDAYKVDRRDMQRRALEAAESARASHVPADRRNPMASQVSP